jgi:hypothetical protein
VRRAGRGRTKKVALVQERRPAKTAMRVLECMVVVVVVLAVVVEWHFKPSLSGYLIYLRYRDVSLPAAAVLNLTLWVSPTARCYFEDLRAT